MKVAGSVALLWLIVCTCLLATLVAVVLSQMTLADSRKYGTVLAFALGFEIAALCGCVGLTLTRGWQRWLGFVLALLNVLLLIDTAGRLLNS